MRVHWTSAVRCTIIFCNVFSQGDSQSWVADISKSPHPSFFLHRIFLWNKKVCIVTALLWVDWNDVSLSWRIHGDQACNLSLVFFLIPFDSKTHVHPSQQKPILFPWPTADDGVTDALVRVKFNISFYQPQRGSANTAGIVSFSMAKSLTVTRCFAGCKEVERHLAWMINIIHGCIIMKIQTFLVYGTWLLLIRIAQNADDDAHSLSLPFPPSPEQTSTHLNGFQICMCFAGRGRYDSMRNRALALASDD